MTDLLESQTFDIRKRFESVVSVQDGELVELLRASGASGSEVDLDFVCEAASWTVPELISATQSLVSEVHVSNCVLQTEIALSDNGLASAVDLMESAISRGVKSLRVRLSEFDINSQSVSSLETFRDQKQRVRFLMANVQSIIDILEIPQLVDQCVASDNFADALSLLEFLNGIARKVQLFIVLPCLEQQAKVSRDKLVGSLEEVLSRKNLKVQDINDLLLVYSIIYPKVDLKVKFTSFRTSFFTERKKKIPSIDLGNSVFKSLKEYTDLVRVQLSDIVSQFKQVFQVNDLDADLVKFVLEETLAYLNFLETTIPKLPKDNLFENMADIYQHASFIKIVEVNACIAYIFHTLLISKAEKLLNESLDIFKVELGQYNWRPSLALIPETSNESRSIVHLTRNRPLAILYNDITQFLNELRNFPLLSTRIDLNNMVETLLRSAFDLLFAAKDKSSESEIARKNFCNILVPHIETYFGTIFGNPCDFRLLKQHPQFIVYQPPINSDVSHVEEGISQ
jgi:hypothetical protein